MPENAKKFDIAEDIAEELEELEAEDFDSDDVISRFVPESNSGLMKDYSHNPFVKSCFPVLFIDKELRIVFANAACEDLYKGFFKLYGNYFIDIFGHSFDIDDIKKIRQTILTGLNGHSWKGISHVKSRTMGKIEAKVFIFPAEISNPNPEVFVVMFDNITEDSMHLLRTIFVSLLEASRLKDNDTGKHIMRVNYYASRMAQELHRSQNPIYQRIDLDYINIIGFLASMHDVGKIGTPDDILNKEGPLSDWEWNIMHAHTINGGFILSSYPHPMAKDIALCHHEWWDGSGYPYKLEGDMIPLAARIVAIADVYDALRMERSYKHSFDHYIAIEQIMDQKNTHFDPALVDVFYGISDYFNEIYESNQDTVRR
jgi:putative two-component system response regulator